MKMIKRVFLLISLIILSHSTFAKDSLLLFKKDGTIIPFALADVDSIKFVKQSSVEVDTISLDRVAVGLLQGNDFMLQAEVGAEEGETVQVKWSSSDSSIASVNDEGNVKALKSGSATITATAGGKQAICAITVIPNGEAVYRHGYSELSASDKAIYNYMLKQILAFQSNDKEYGDINHRVYLDFYSHGMSVNKDKVMKITNLIIKDVPEVYTLVNYIYRYDYDKNQYYLRVKSSCTPEKYASEMAQINEVCNTITSTITATTTEFEKAKIIHDGFIAWADYGGMSNANSGDITGSFITRRAVCEGFSRAYLMLCQRVGLKCLYVTGSIITSTVNQTWGNHAWNITEVDDSWYLVDITGDGAFPDICGYSKFLLGTNSFSDSYKYEGTGGADEDRKSVV